MASAARALDTGQYEVAIEAATQASEEFAASGAPSEFGKAQNLIGAAHLYKGEYDAALPFFESALEASRQTNDQAAEIERLNNIGNVHFFSGRYAQAFAVYQTALKRLRAEDWDGQKLTLTNLAVLHQQLGQNQIALDLYRQVLAAPSKRSPSEEAQILTNLAIAYRRLGDPYKAMDRYREAQRMLAGDRNAAAGLYLLHNIGVVQALDLEDLDAARKTFSEALALAQRSRSKREIALEHLFLGETMLRMGRRAAAKVEFVEALSISEELHLVDELWTALYGIGRAGDQAEAEGLYRRAIAVIETERNKLGEGSSLKAEFLADKRDVYDAMTATLLDRATVPVDGLLRQVESGRARNLKEQLPTGAGIRQQLDARTALLVYWMAGSRMAIVWVTRDASGVVKHPLSQDQGRQLELLLRALQDRNASADWRSLANGLSPLLLPPLHGLPASVDRLIIVPDGLLYRLPFEVLALADGSRVVERFAVSYLPSSAFLRVAAKKSLQWPWQTQVAIFADPVAVVADGLFDPNWQKLAGSVAEAESIARALPGAARVHSGANNLKRLVFSEGPQTPVLHFATHAAVDVADSRRSRLLFSPESSDAGSQYLFASEIAAMRLSAVELVTLAACESERGRFVKGEGVENFSRAFLGAGAEATVSSLWRVSDEVTALLMQRFYRGLAAGKSKTDALREAKLALLRTGGDAAHPYFWSAFVLSGDGASPLSRVVPWWLLLLLATVMAAVAIIALVRGWRSRPDSKPAR